MKLTLTKRDLSKALGLVSPYIKSRNTLPILSCVSIEAIRSGRHDDKRNGFGNWY